MLTTTRRQPCIKAYTIIESLVVLVILTVLTMVILALLNHQNKPAEAADETSTTTNNISVDTLPPAAPEDETE